MTQKYTALITGTTNGIGYELAKIFAANNFDIISVARNEDKLKKLENELAEFGCRVHSIPTDLSSYEEIKSLKARVNELNVEIHSLVINAGQGLGGKFIGGTSLEKELSLIRLNVDSVVHMAKIFIPGMIKQGHGDVLMTSSVSGTTPIPYEAVYGASKAFVNSLFWAIRNEINGSPLHMTLLLPGATETNFFKNAGQASTQVGSGNKADPADVAKRAWYALSSRHEVVYGDDDAEWEGEVLNRNLSESQKAQRHRIISEPENNTVKE
ncbi:SDR family NAD(P)-dependent oxidoreductase [Alteromonas confluentis]|uniref:Short-chain dehydrogenase n=1 Tax=Alteromonas confluentis TaxID=1656094 RepID=A0A1E7Z779_9ALTE|nr:SDR family NAD(P)-dependent oxidoreductase [Alteromonas confluentis]OFC69386.1 short-chain dehydrogenase [Alteromonas confluentis]